MKKQTTGIANDFAFGEQSGGYVFAAATRHSLPIALSVLIHEQAVAAFRNGEASDANPYPNGCPAFLQWEHSYDEYKEACDTSDEFEE